jgi:glucose/arabinose dehydrogenase
MGDGGSGGDPQNHAQDRTSLLGKLLAFDVDKGSGKPAIVAIGLRNPWRFSFAPDGKSIWIGDVGQNSWEEIDHTPFPMPADANFGWRLLEASHPFADGGQPPKGYIPPVFEYSHNDGCSVTGGVELPGNAYLFGDYCSAKYWLTVGDKTTPAKLDIPAPVSFGVDAGGRLLVASGDGSVYLVTPEPSAA